ncbi:hypothetical protein G5I_13781 [Acromyrmex echinatior]|uniref:Uncharacterized protein n=1 Tax=Acromyrmex echinatior TaxID=103372 RepID=F4X5Y8_ACREC|nr:hypothetical protein G5I_13781 [Acromyrmex echinatior]
MLKLFICFSDILCLTFTTTLLDVSNVCPFNEPGKAQTALSVSAPRFCQDCRTMYNTRIVYYGVLLLLAAVTNTDSTKCSRIIEGTTAPRSNAMGKYDFFLTLFNRTDKVYAYMPNTRYNVLTVIIEIQLKLLNPMSLSEVTSSVCCNIQC